jgi:hypothetical protein
MLHKEVRDVRALGARSPMPGLPPHLAGLPECLHKYAPLFAEREAAELIRGETAA